MTTFRAVLADPNQPSRVVPLNSKTPRGAMRECGPLRAGVLPGGTVQVQEMDGDNWRTVRSCTAGPGSPRWT